MLEFEIDRRVAEVFPEVAVGGFLAGDLDAVDWDDAAGAFTATAEELEAQGVTLQNLTEDPRVAGWRDAIGRCGLKPSTFKSSPEQLARRVLKGQDVSTPLPLVDAYCAVSVRHLAPMGAYDLARLPQPRVTLRHGRPEEDRFLPLGGRPEDMPVTDAVVVYGCGDEVICWAFNHRDSRVTCLTPDTPVAAFFTEAVSGAQRAASEAALAEMARRLEEAGARVGAIRFADAAEPQRSLDL